MTPKELLYLGHAKLALHPLTMEGGDCKDRVPAEWEVTGTHHFL